jgi:hypothetical protein
MKKTGSDPRGAPSQPLLIKKSDRVVLEIVGEGQP